MIDASVLFPQFKGLLFKKSLKKVTEDELGEVIQENREGHSSIEDAQACIRRKLQNMDFHKLLRDPD